MARIPNRALKTVAPVRGLITRVRRMRSGPGALFQVQLEMITATPASVARPPMEPTCSQLRSIERTQRENFSGRRTISSPAARRMSRSAPASIASRASSTSASATSTLSGGSSRASGSCSTAGSSRDSIPGESSVCGCSASDTSPATATCTSLVTAPETLMEPSRRALPRARALGDLFRETGSRLRRSREARPSPGRAPSPRRPPRVRSSASTRGSRRGA